MSTNTIEGTIEEIGGKIRSTVDHDVGDKEGERQGKIDQVKGNIKKNIGLVEDKIKETLED
jgi:uncharacterized protein YjbJ (UPF0337 family)